MTNTHLCNVVSIQTSFDSDPRALFEGTSGRVLNNPHNISHLIIGYHHLLPLAHHQITNVFNCLHYYTDRQTDKQINKHTDGQTDGRTDRQAGGETDRDRQADKQMTNRDGQKDKTDRQAGRWIYT